MRSVLFFVAAAAFVSSICAKEIVITVGGNTTSNPGAVYSPQSVMADPGDVVLFNFTEGNHTVTQSSFASPCTPVHVTNSTVNGFDSSFRDTDNGTAITQLTVPVPNNTTIWFFDWNTCALGGVGGININDSSSQTLDGFARNAVRLNGTKSSSSSGSASETGSATATSPSSSSTTATSSANRVAVIGLSGMMPVLSMLLAL